jgi:hypothetical protein
LKDVILFSDTVPPVILKQALLAAGFRLRGFYIFRRHRWPRFKFRNVITEIRIGFCCLTQCIFSPLVLFFSSFPLFFYTQSDKENGILQAIVALKKTFNLPKAPAHISDLSRNYSYRKKRFFCVGAPGSGNMIFLAISNKILNNAGPHQERIEPDPVGHFLQSQALLYMEFVKSRLRAALKPFLISDSIGPEGFGRCFFAGLVSREKTARTKPSPDFLFLASDLPLNHQAWANPLHTSHANLSMQDLLLFRKNNTDVIQIIRHPLDNLLSITSKIAIKCAPLSSLGGREVWIEKLLNTEPWFYSLFEAIENYYKNVCENRNLVKIIKYEALFQNPKETIQKLASYFQRFISDTEASEMFSLLVSKDLAGDGHRWKPGPDKWKRYIPRKYSEYLDRSNLKKLCRMLDYDAPDFANLHTRKCSPAPKASSEVLALEEIRYYFLINKQPFFKHPNIKLFEDPVTGIKVGGLGSHVNAVRKMFVDGTLF